MPAPSQELGIDYEAVLIDLEAKRDALDAAIAAFRNVVKMGAHVGVAAVGGARQVDPQNLPNDAFFGMSIGEAAKKYLGIVKRKQSTREIADALDRGGLPHTSSNFLNTVTTMLSRQARTDAELVKVGREWGLAAWYGNRRPAQARTSKAPKRSAVAKPKTKGGSAASSIQRSWPALAEDAIRDSGRPMTVDELIEAIRDKSGRTADKAVLVGVLARLAKAGKTFSRPAPSTYGLLD